MKDQIYVKYMKTSQAFQRVTFQYNARVYTHS